MSGGPPDTIETRHVLIASLEAAGYRNVEIARILEMNAARISVIQTSPKYQAVLVEEREKFIARLQAGRLEQVEALFPDAIRAKAYCLNQVENLAVANAASDSILDRVAPRKQTGGGGGETVVTVRLTVEDERRIARALVEDGGTAIDITPPSGDDADDA